tara:strand:- start:5643 stop:6266 length:624 start_codon:yes stop_codon:yes gene_type:complete
MLFNSISQENRNFLALQMAHKDLLEEGHVNEKIKSSSVNEEIKSNNTGFNWGYCIYRRNTVFQTIGNETVEIVYNWPRFKWYLKTQEHLKLCRKYGEIEDNYAPEFNTGYHNYYKAVSENEYENRYIERIKIADNMYSKEFKEYISNIREFSGSCNYYEDICDKDRPVYSVGHGHNKRLVVPIERYDTCHHPDLNSEHDIVIYTFDK